MEAKKDKVTRSELRHDRHTVSLLTEHLVFSPKYRGKVLLGEVAEATEENFSFPKKGLPYLLNKRWAFEMHFEK
ncbi:MAG: hypothetical protein QMD22_08505 [archaeon]|nr:hypothetical protein [archaeon]